MNYVFLSSDALVSFAVVLMVTGFALVFQPNIDLNDRLLFQQAQDLVEVCSIKNDLSDSCFSFFRHLHPDLDYCLNNCSGYKHLAVLINRDYVEFGIVYPD